MHVQHVILERPQRPLPAQVRDPSDLQPWRDELDRAERSVRDLEGQRSRMLTTASTEALRKHDDTTATARLRVERASTVIRQAEERFARDAARLAAEQPERRKAYAAALKARDEAEKIIRDEYAPAAARIAKALARVADLRATITAANAARPEGAAPIPSPDAFRGWPACESSVRTVTETFYVNGDGEEVKPGAIVTRPDGGPAPARSYDARSALIPQTRERTVSDPGSPGYEPRPLEQTVSLPSVQHDLPDFWTGADAR